MHLQIINETGKPYDTRVIDLDTGQSIPVTRVDIEPYTQHNHWCPGVTITLPRHALHLVTDKVTVQTVDPSSSVTMTRQEALEQAKHLAATLPSAPNPDFEWGRQYGMRLALMQVFGLKYEEL